MALNLAEDEHLSNVIGTPPLKPYKENCTSQPCIANCFYFLGFTLMGNK